MKTEILFKYFRGEATREEEAAIAEWLKTGPDARKELRDARFMFVGLALNADPAKAGGKKKKPDALRKVVVWTAGIAASLLLLAGVGYATYDYGYDAVAEQVNVIEVPAGQRMNLTLNDGSRICLNSGARLEYPVAFSGKKREVKLSGEGLFDVEHDASKPFIVNTFASKIEVLGTKFNVDADERHGRFTTALIEGSVRIENTLDPSQPHIILKPDDIAGLSCGRIVVNKIRGESPTCWTEGLIYVNGLTFPELMAKFEKAFDIKIVIEMEKMPDLGALGGKIRVNEGIEKALGSLQYAADFDYSLDSASNTVTIH